MAIHFQYEIHDDMGLHARPAGLLAKKVKTLPCRVTVSCRGVSCDARKLIQLMSLEAQKGDILEFAVDGADEEAAARELGTFLKEVI